MSEPDFSALWQAFRGKDRDRVIVGVAAAFALVAAANGALDAAETQRFLDVVRGSRLAPGDAATEQQLAKAFDDLARTLLARPDWDIAVQKTGYTLAAGQCLVMSTVIEGRSVVIVLLNLLPIGYFVETSHTFQ